MQERAKEGIVIPSESALIVRVPEAEALVGTFRDRFDPFACLCLPSDLDDMIAPVAPIALRPDAVASRPGDLDVVAG